MSKEYQIKLTVDTTSSDQSLARQDQKLGQVEQKFKRMGDAQEAGAKRGADAGFVSFLKLDAQAEKLTKRIAVEADKQARIADRQADQKIKADQRVADKAARVAQQAADKLIREDQRVAAQAQRSADQKAKADERAWAKVAGLAGRAFTDQEVRFRALGTIQDRLNDRRVAAATKVAEAERRAGLPLLEQFKEQFGLLDGKINPATLAWSAGLGAAALVTKGMLKDWEGIAKGIGDAVAFQTKYREGLPENAALKGHLGDTTKEAKESLALRTKTLQTPEQAKEFEGGFLNSIQASLASGRISDVEANRLKVLGGAFQSAENGSAETHGEFVGRLPALITPKKDAAGQDIPVTADQVQAEESRIFKILSEGRSTFTSGTKQLLANSNLTTTGAFTSIAEQAALQSAFSVTSPEQAGEYLRWGQRGTVGSLHDPETAAYFQRLGVQDQKRQIPISDAVASDLTRAQKEAKAAGKDFSGDDYLRTQGFKSDESIRYHLAYTASKQSGEMDKFLAMKEGVPDAKAIQDKIAEARADPRMQDLSRQVTEENAKFSFDRAHGTADEFRKSVFAAATTTGAMSGRFEDAQDYLTLSRNNPRRLQEHANAWLQFSAKRAGVKVDDLGTYNPLDRQIDIDKRYQYAIDKIQAAGRDPFADVRAFTAGKAQMNLNSSIAAEAPARAGLGAAMAKRREQGRIPDMIAAADQPPGQGLAAARGQFGGIDSWQPYSQGMGARGSSPVDIALHGLVERLIRATEQTNRLLANQQNKAPDPLPIAGQGRNWRDRP